MGVIEAMIRSIKDNRRVRGGQKTMRDRNGDYGYERSNPLIFDDSMSKEEHKFHQQEWKSRKRTANLKLGILIVVFILIVFIGLIWLSVL